MIQSSPAGRSACSMRASVSMTAVTHHHHALQFEALPELVDLRRQRHRIGGVAFKHLDRNGAAAAAHIRPITSCGRSRR